MAKQHYKSIYFPDAPGNTSREKNITLAFGEDDVPLIKFTKAKSSEQLRAIIGHQTFDSVNRASKKVGIGISSYIKSRLRAGCELRQDDPSYQVVQLTQGDSIPPELATFRGGIQEPLHNWFKYLEGYSPDFVKRIIEQHAPKARVVLDPFGGTGTTAIVSAQLGLDGLYCEVNPVLNHVSSAKRAILMLSKRERITLADRLRHVTFGVSTWEKCFEPCEELRATYVRLFGESVYFDDRQMKQVLIARSAVDHLGREEGALIEKLVLTASFSSLLICSRLIRRGDVRFKTQRELSSPIPEYFGEVKSKILSMADDIEKLEDLPGRIIQLADDAKSLKRLPISPVDVVVTSPPYLNGTNYIRNTKIELWFSRVLVDERDIRQFRTKTITSGINDVNSERILSQELPESIAKIVRSLERNAYDGRIGRMVSGYFTDLGEVFTGIARHLNKDGKIVIDIGDSEYAGIHVPTHALLDDLLKMIGLDKTSEIILRKRRSRAGRALSQTLLVYQSKRRTSAKKIELTPKLAPESGKMWRHFKRHLPHQSGDRAKRNWGHPLHSLCSYQGKMKPSLAASLVETFVPKDGRFLDPFGGVGTLPFEAALRGSYAISFDISPIAIPISKAKVENVDSSECEDVLNSLFEEIEANSVSEEHRLSATKIRFNGPLADYFSPETFREILIARDFFIRTPPKSPAQSMVFASLLHILHGNRPYALSRNSHPLTPFAPTGPSEYRALMPRLRTKVERSLSCDKGESFISGKVYSQDATQAWPILVDNLDAIITSPPFFDSIKFHTGNWMRLWFAGWDLDDFSIRPKTFVDERQKVDFSVYESIMRQSKERLSNGGVLVMHLGKSNKCNMAEELMRQSKRWFRAVDLFDETVAHCESHGVSDKGSVSAHQFLVMM